MLSTGEMGKGWTSVSTAEVAYADAIKAMSAQMWTMVSTEAPDYAYLTSPICECFEKWSDALKAAAAREERVGDDVRDCYERFIAIHKLDQERLTWCRNLDQARDKLKAFKEVFEKNLENPEYDTRKGRQQLRKLNSDRRLALEKTIELTEKVVEQKKKFGRFEYVRAKHAYETLAALQRNERAAEREAVNALIESLRKAREQIGLDLAERPKQLSEERAEEQNQAREEMRKKALERKKEEERQRQLEKERKEREEAEAEAARIAAANRRTEYDAIMEADKASGKKRGLVFESDLFDEITKGPSKQAPKAEVEKPKAAAPAKRGKLFDTSDFDFTPAPKRQPKKEEKPPEQPQEKPKPKPKPKPAGKKPLFGDAEMFPGAGSAAKQGGDDENESLFDDF